MNDFDSLFREYHERLLLFALKHVESVSDALDIVQNVFLAVWENGKYKDDHALIHSYLFRAVKNSCINYLKHQRVVRKFENETLMELREMEVSHYMTGESSLIEKEKLEQIDAAIDSLTDIYREVILLSRFEGLKNQEIADKLELPVRTVETRIFRALIMLRERISRKYSLILLKMSCIKY